MTVILTKSIPPTVRGSLRKWVIEIEPGVFLGDLTARVRTELLDWLVPQMGGGRALVVYSDRKSQTGYQIKTLTKEGRRSIKTISGIPLIEIKPQQNNVSTKETFDREPF
jgi:CRISPR-associated protein Cas2